MSESTRWRLRIGANSATIDTQENENLSQIIADLISGFESSSLGSGITITNTGNVITITDDTLSIVDADGSGDEGIELSIIRQGSGTSNVSVASTTVTNGVPSAFIPTRWRYCVSLDGTVVEPTSAFLTGGRTAAQIAQDIVDALPGDYFTVSATGSTLVFNGLFEAPLDVAIEFDEGGTVSSNVTTTKSVVAAGAYPTATGLNVNGWSNILPFQAGIRSVTGPGVTIVTTDDQVFEG